MQTYSSQQGGYTPQGQAVASAAPNAVNSAPPPNAPSSAYGSDAQLNQSYAEANANNVSAALPETRGAMINNSNIPSQQANYDDLAKQLFEYDTGVLNPKFGGTNPGTPTDAAAFGRVDASPLGLTVGSAGLPSSSGTYNSNPKYALSSQVDQGNALVDLLSTLNRGISSSFDTTKGLYANKTESAQRALDGIIKLMGLKESALDREAARASKGETPEDVKNRLLADAKKGVTFTDLVIRYAADGLTPSQVRELYNKVNYYGKAATETDSDVMGILAGTKPTAQQAKEKAAKAKTDAYDLTKGTVQNILSQYNNLGGLDKGGPAGSLLASNPYGAGHTYEQQRKGLVIALKDLTGAGTGSGVRITNAEIKTWSDLLPAPGDTQSQAKTKLQSLNKQLTQKFGKGLDSEYVGGAQAGNKGTVIMTGPKGSFNVPADKVEVFKKNGYK